MDLMATVSFPKAEVEKQLKIKLNEETLSKIQMMGIPAELGPDSLDIEVLVSRPDIISMQGFLRAYKSYYGKEQIKKYKVEKSGYKLIVDKSLPKEWPYAVACIVKGIEFNDARIKEVIDIQEKLGVTMLRKRKKGGIGLYPLEKIKFPVYLKGLEPNKIKFRPLELAEELNGLQIIQKHPTGREYAPIVQDWKTFPVFIDDSNKIMSMPPIINSHDLGKIDASTKNVFIEATGPDLNTLKKAMNILVCALADMGGKVYSIECNQQNGQKEVIPDLSGESIKISLENTNKLLGLVLKEKDLEKLLPKMGYEYSKGKVQVPAWRSDILHEVDIIEDIAIAYGYDNLVPQIPKVATIGKESTESKLTCKITNILAGLGMLEVSSYHLIKEEEAQNIKLGEDKIETENSKTEYKILRPNLLVPALRIFAENKDNEYPQRLFEIGTVFKKSARSDTGIAESTNLLVACSPSNFTEVKQVLDYISRMLRVQFSLKESNHPQLIEGRTGEVLLNNKSIGYIGEVHPKTLRDFNIRMPIAILEISLQEIFDLIKGN